MENTIEEKDFYREFGNLSDSYKIYLCEAGGYDLLTADEEKELSKRILDGDSDALKELVERNLLLVAKVAKDFSWSGLSMEDLVQEGNIGLIKAAQYFDYKKGNRFSTYAVPSIRQSLFRAISNTGKTIRVPSYLNEKMLKIKSFVDGRIKSTGIKPTIAEITEELGMSVTEIENIRLAFQPVASLNSPLSTDEESGELLNYIEDDRNFYEELFDEDVSDAIWVMFDYARFTEKEVNVMILRFGFFDRPKTLEEIGNIYGVTRERVRQMEVKAFKKVLDSKYAGITAGYTNDAYGAIDNATKNRRTKINYVFDGQPIIVALMSIYRFFKDYSKEEIDIVISSLSLQEFMLLEKRYGNDFSKPVCVEVNGLESKYFYTVIVPKMKNMLEENRELQNRSEVSRIRKRG